MSNVYAKPSLSQLETLLSDGAHAASLISIQTAPTLYQTLHGIKTLEKAKSNISILKGQETKQGLSVTQAQQIRNKKLCLIGKFLLLRMENAPIQGSGVFFKWTIGAFLESDSSKRKTETTAGYKARCQRMLSVYYYLGRAMAGG